MCGRAFKQKYDCKKHEDLHYRNPGAYLKQRWPKSSKNTVTVIEQDNEDTSQVESKEIDESSIRIVQIEASENVEEAIEETAEAAAEITEVTGEVTAETTEEGVTKIYEYHEGGVREIVISQVALAEEDPITKQTIWRV